MNASSEAKVLDAIRVDGAMGSVLRAVCVRTGFDAETARALVGSLAQAGQVRVELRQYLGVEAFEVFHATGGAR